MWNRLRRGRPLATVGEWAAAHGHPDAACVDDDPMSPREAEQVNDQLDVSVHDSEVLDEIEMMTNLIIATSESDGPLSQPRIDAILGLPSH